MTPSHAGALIFWGWLGAAWLGCAPVPPPPLPADVEREAFAAQYDFKPQPIREDSSLLDLSAKPVQVEPIPYTRVVKAEHPSLLVIKQSQGGVNKQTFIVTYREELDQPKRIPMELLLTNTSNRAFAVTGVTVRGTSSNPSAKLRHNGTLSTPTLAPGESSVFTFEIEGVQSLRQGDTFALQLFELPKSLSGGGAVNRRTQATLAIEVTAKDQSFTLKTFTRREERQWTGYAEAPADLINHLKN